MSLERKDVAKMLYVVELTTTIVLYVGFGARRCGYESSFHLLAARTTLCKLLLSLCHVHFGPT
jgi:hypothetical protein